MEWTWFDLHWSWLGLALSSALLLLLLTTNVLRGDVSSSRWRDPVWLAWLAPAAYMIHQFEEYGIDAHGTRFAFPDFLCVSVGMPPYPACSLPEPFFAAVNIPAIWIAGLACGLLSRRHPFVGLGLYGLHSTNALSHVGVALINGAYNPGALASAVISLPLSLWVGYACFVQGRMRRRGQHSVARASGTILAAGDADLKFEAEAKSAGPLLGEVCIEVRAKEKFDKTVRIAGIVK